MFVPDIPLRRRVCLGAVAVVAVGLSVGLIVLLFHLLGSDDRPDSPDRPDRPDSPDSPEGPDSPDGPDGSRSGSSTSSSGATFSSLKTYALTLTPALWEKLQATAVEENYVRARVAIGGENYDEDIGLRFKGGFGTLTACAPEGTWDRNVCPRLSMKIKFTEYEGKAYKGAKMLNFHSMLRDGTKMHEKISYALFNAVGVDAPRSHWAKLEVNDEDLGLFSVVEEVDVNFVEAAGIDKKTNQLYKATWLDTTSPEVFEAGLEEGDSEHSSILSLQDALNTAPRMSRLQTLGSYFDTAALFNYMAVHTTIVNWDGITGFYCGTTAGVSGCGNSNYYIYRSKGDDFTLIPWDMDNTLNISLNIFRDVPKWNGASDETVCLLRYPLADGKMAKSPSCSPFFQALAEDPAAFAGALDRFLNGPWKKVGDDIEKWRKVIAPHVPEDEKAAWNNGVDRLKADIPIMTKRALTYKQA